MNVRAAVLEETGSPLAIRDLALDEPRANEVQVRLVATGVCHTDAAVRDGLIPTRSPVVLGHEGAGVVETVGEGVDHLHPGDHVVLSVNSCGTCRQCYAGHPSSCLRVNEYNFEGGRRDGTSAFAAEDGTAVGSHFFGQSSFAERVNASVRSVVKIPEDLPLELAAPLGCGLQTGAGAVLNVLDPAPGGSLVVFGAGTVGLAAVMAAAARRLQTVIAVDVHAHRLELAAELGATHTINGAEEDTVSRIREITGEGMQTALDTTGNPQVFRQMVDSLGPWGHAGLVGASPAGAEAVVDMPSALSGGLQLSWIVEGDAVPQLFIPELIALHRAGDFPFDKLIKHYAFDEIAEAFADSASGDVLKPVLTFAEESAAV